MTIESVVWDEWYPVAIQDDVEVGRRYKTQLLGRGIEYMRTADGTLIAWDSGEPQALYCARTKYRTCWVSLGRPQDKFFELPEFFEKGRHIVGAGSMTVHTSGLRTIENFLDMAHFPFVHDGYLGGEPYTDVEPYNVTVEPNGEIFARDCHFFQPRGAVTASAGGYDTQYTYRVARPYVAFLYKSNPLHPSHLDVIGLFVQPRSDEWCTAHTLLVLGASDTPDSDQRAFQQTIFGQDLMLLNNELPHTLPLDVGTEIPVRADAMSMTYRRWLAESGVRYGTC